MISGPARSKMAIGTRQTISTSLGGNPAAIWNEYKPSQRNY